ncbi:VTT domain-containing protein [Candidatus Saccharibacteria bacterium]|nr:VTT domain-containing protein [Candidatus Saccharibacteria bacterium]
MALSIDKWILGGGLIAIGGTVFAESGLLIGFFLPGDTLLFGAGILAAQGVFNLPLLIAVIIFSAVLGDNVGYSIGRRSGKRLFSKKESILFRPEHVQRAEKFYERHGGKTIILARFIPVVRTFAPMIAGVSKMPRRRFFVFNVIGGVLWGGGVTLAGYWLGIKLPWLEDFITPVILGIVGLSVFIAVFHIIKDKKVRQLLFMRMKSWLSVIFLNKKIN